MVTDAIPESDAAPQLIGCGGWVNGETFSLKEGEEVIIGRSRSCDISLRRIEGYTSRPAAERDNDYDFNTVSRRHVRLAIQGRSVEIEDLSSNGSFCDEERLVGVTTVDLGAGPVRLRLGTREAFLLKIPGLIAEAPAEEADDPADGPTAPPTATDLDDAV